MLESEIKKKYLKPPPIEEILSFIKSLGVTYAQFERFYAMHEGVIKNVKAGTKQLPVKYWPIFYNRIVPQYGMNYKKEKSKRKSKSGKVSKKVSPEDPTVLTKLQNQIEGNQ